jgi:hypothetical protein
LTLWIHDYYRFTAHQCVFQGFSKGRNQGSL